MMNTARPVTLGVVVGLLSLGAEDMGGERRTRGLQCVGEDRSERQREMAVCTGQV